MGGQFRALHLRHGTGEVHLFLNTVAHNHCLLKTLCVFGELDIDILLACVLYFLRVVADIGDADYRTLLKPSELKVSAGICHGTLVGTFYYYGHADKRTRLVGYHTGNFLHGCRYARYRPAVPVPSGVAVAATGAANIITAIVFFRVDMIG